MNDTLLNIKIGKWVVSYLIITYIIYLLIPSNATFTKSTYELYTIVFLLCVCVSFYYGCKRVSIEKKLFSVDPSQFVLGETKIAMLVSFYTIVTILYLNDMVQSGFAQLSLSMGDNYANMIESEIKINSFWGQIYTLLSPLRVFLVTYCIVHFKKLSIPNICLLILLLLSYLMITVSKGQFVGIGNVAVFLAVPLFFMNWQEHRINRFKRQIVIIGITFITLFIVNQFARAESLESDIIDMYSADNIICQVLGTKIGTGVLRFLAYFSHGYRGLNYSLQLPFEWTFGYGGSIALSGYMQQYFGMPTFFEDTYPMRVLSTFGYDCQLNWPTAFAWWASDFSFPGVVIVMFFLGKLFCMVFRDACYHLDIIAISLLSELVIMVFFLPMNNQAFQTRESFLITFFLFIVWLFRRRSFSF